MIFMYKKIGVVGDKDSVLAFKAIGIDVFPVVEADEARVAVDRMAMNGYAVIFITEQVAVTIEETIERYNKQMLPAVILIPSSLRIFIAIAPAATLPIVSLPELLPPPL